MTSKKIHNSTEEDIEKVLAMGLYTPSQSIPTGELRDDSLQRLVGQLAHHTFPADKESLIKFITKRDPAIQNIELIKNLPRSSYSELAILIKDIMDLKINSTTHPKASH